MDRRHRTGRQLRLLHRQMDRLRHLSRRQMGRLLQTLNVIVPVVWGKPFPICLRPELFRRERKHPKRVMQRLYRVLRSNSN